MTGEEQIPEPVDAVRAGTRLGCPVCGFELVVTKAGRHPSLACHVPLEVARPQGTGG